MGSVRSDGCELYYEEVGEGVPILLIHPAGSTASTWGSATEELARIGRVITYDRRGYARSGGEPARSISTHTADAAAILESLRAQPAVVVGTSAGAAITVDLAVRRPDLVRVVIAHEFPWRFTRHLPTVSQVAALAKIGSLVLRGRERDAAETLLRSAYTYRDGASAWDAFPEEWRRAGRDSARAALADFRNSIGSYPSAADLATVKVPVVCSYGARSPDNMFRLVRSLASAIPNAKTHQIEGAGHAAPFDATSNFVQLIADTVTSLRIRSQHCQSVELRVDAHQEMRPPLGRSPTAKAGADRGAVVESAERTRVPGRAGRLPRPARLPQPNVEARAGRGPETQLDTQSPGRRQERQRNYGLSRRKLEAL